MEKFLKDGGLVTTLNHFGQWSDKWSGTWISSIIERDGNKRRLKL